MAHFFHKRVALICLSDSLGGLELSTLRFAAALCGRDVPTFLIVPPGSPLHERAVDEGIGVVPLLRRWKYGDPTAVMHLARILDEYHIDIALLMQSNDVHLAALAAVVVPKTKLVYYQQMQSAHDKRDLFHTWIYSKLSLWISLTQRMKQDVLTFTRVPKDKVKVIPLGTDLEQFNPMHYNKAEARAYFGLPLKKNIVGVLGRLDTQKGQDVLLRAVPRILTHHSDILVLLVGNETVGEPGYKARLQSLAQSLHIEAHVRFLPFTENVPRMMAALDIFALPSFSETFGLVVVEAMAMGKPIIATNAGGVPEIIMNGKTGLLIEPHSSNDIARAIHRILSNDALRDQLALSARAEALRHYSFERSVEALLNSLAML